MYCKRRLIQDCVQQLCLSSVLVFSSFRSLLYCPTSRKDELSWPSCRSLLPFLQFWAYVPWSDLPYHMCKQLTLPALAFCAFLGLQSVFSRSQSHHYYFLWPAKKVIDSISLSWPHERFDNGCLFLVAHISVWLLCLCTFPCKLVCLFVGLISTYKFKLHILFIYFFKWHTYWLVNTLLGVYISW